MWNLLILSFFEIVICLVRLKISGCTSIASGETAAEGLSRITACHQTTLPNIWSHLEAAGRKTQKSCRSGSSALQQLVYLLVLCLQPGADERLPPGGSPVPLPGLCGLSGSSSGSRRALSAAPSHDLHPQSHPEAEAPAGGSAELD